MVFRTSWRVGSLIALILFATLAIAPVINGTDPLPSWQEGDSKKSIIEFIDTITNPSNPSYVVPKDRIATFDLDGTLWVEKPRYADLDFHLKDMREKAENPNNRDRSPFVEIRENRLPQNPDEIWNVTNFRKEFANAYGGLDEDEYVERANEFLQTLHPSCNERYKDLAYMPMLELIKYLKENKFKVYIVSGASTGLIRSVSNEIFGVEKENVIGTYSNLTYKFENEEPHLFRINSSKYNLASEKPISIINHIGQNPILACGNSAGDAEMLQFTQYNSELKEQNQRLSCIIKHDSREEFPYEDNYIEENATRYGWLIVSMNNDWNRIFEENIDCRNK